MALTKLDAFEASLKDEWNYVMHGARLLLGYCVGGAITSKEEFDELEAEHPVVKEVVADAAVWATAKGFPVVPIEHAGNAIVSVAQELLAQTAPSLSSSLSYPQTGGIIPPEPISTIGGAAAAIKGAGTVLLLALGLSLSLSACSATDALTVEADALPCIQAVNAATSTPAGQTTSQKLLSGALAAQNSPACQAINATVVNAVVTATSKGTPVVATPTVAPVPVPPSATPSAILLAPATPAGGIIQAAD